MKPIIVLTACLFVLTAPCAFADSTQELRDTFGDPNITFGNHPQAPTNDSM